MRLREVASCDRCYQAFWQNDQIIYPARTMFSIIDIIAA